MCEARFHTFILCLFPRALITFVIVWLLLSHSTQKIKTDNDKKLNKLIQLFMSLCVENIVWFWLNVAKFQQTS